MNGFGILTWQKTRSLLVNRFLWYGVALLCVFLLFGSPGGVDGLLTTTSLGTSLVLVIAAAGIIDREYASGFAAFVLTKPIALFTYHASRSASLSVAVAVPVVASCTVMCLLNRSEVPQVLELSAILWLQLACWAVCLVGLSAFVRGLGNSLAFYILLIVGSVLMAAGEHLGTEYAWLAGFGEALHPPNLLRLRNSGPHSLPDFLALGHVVVYPSVLAGLGLLSARRRDLALVRT